MIALDKMEVQLNILVHLGLVIKDKVKIKTDFTWSLINLYNYFYIYTH